MMKYIKRIHIVCSIACFGLNPNLWSDTSRTTQITFFVREYPEFVKEPTNFNEKKDKISHPSYPHAQKIKALIDPDIANGIFATYGGFLVISSPDGQISFPVGHDWTDKPTVFLVITNRVTPIMMNSTTIHHWEMEEKTPAAMYKMVRTKEAGNDIVFWDVTTEPLPENRIIPNTSILIFAKPDTIYVPTGIVLAEDTPNLHLPDIYVKPEINKLSNALYVLYLRHFFGPVRRALKKEKGQHPHFDVILTTE
jgi:hypothetical protein